MKPIVQYDSSKEDLIDKYICEIDKNIIICTNPIEGISYLGIPYTKINAHYFIFNGYIRKYKKYIQEFVQNNQGSPESYEYVETTLTWLLNKFKNARKQFLKLPFQSEWSIQSLNLETFNTKKNGDSIIVEEDNTREAYQIFGRITKTQLRCLEELIDFITDQLLPIKVNNIAMTPYKKAAEKVESEIVYVFRLTESASNKRTVILGTIYKGLKNYGYIDCAPPEFKRLFINYNDKKPTSTPPAIIWNCKYYNPLGYFIHCIISGKVISYAKLPSNNKIALNLFHNGKEGNPYSTKGKRYGGRLNPKDKAKIAAIIKGSLKKSELTTIQS